MGLKDIFTMIKADRYTADGREEIKKAQKAMAEDAGLPDGTLRHRKDGDYIKQGGKWKPAPAGKAPGAKTGPGKSPNETINAKRAQQKESEKADYNRNIRSFHENTGLNGGPEEVLARKEAEKADRKQDNLQPGKRDDSMFKAKDKVEFARHGKYMNGEIESIRKDWKGNVQMQVKGEDGQSYFVEAGDITKHSSSESKPTEPKLKEGVMNSKKAQAFKPELEEIRKSNPSRFRENLIDILSSWTDQNDAYLQNSALTNLMNLYNYERKQMYETGDSAPRVLTGDCKIRIRKR